MTADLSLQGLEIVFRVGLAILQMNQTELIQLDMEGMLQVYDFHITCHCTRSGFWWKKMCTTFKGGI